MGDYGHYIICTLFSCCSIQEKVTKWHFIPTCIPVVPWQAFKWSMMASLTSHSFIICDDSSSISDYVAVKTINSCFILFVFPPLRSWIHAVSYGGGCRLGRESGHSRRHFRVNLCLAITMTTSWDRNLHRCSSVPRELEQNHAAFCAMYRHKSRPQIHDLDTEQQKKRKKRKKLTRHYSAMNEEGIRIYVFN